MSHDKITHYMDELPAVTQYYDLNTLFGLPDDDLRDWTEYDNVWCDVSFSHIYRRYLCPTDCASCEDIT